MRILYNNSSLITHICFFVFCFLVGSVIILWVSCFDVHCLKYQLLSANWFCLLRSKVCCFSWWGMGSPSLWWQVCILEKMFTVSSGFESHAWTAPDSFLSLSIHDTCRKLFELLSLSVSLAEPTWPAILNKRHTFRYWLYSLSKELYSVIYEARVRFRVRVPVPVRYGGTTIPKKLGYGYRGYIY